MHYETVGCLGVVNLVRLRYGWVIVGVPNHRLVIRVRVAGPDGNARMRHGIYTGLG